MPREANTEDRVGEHGTLLDREVRYGLGEQPPSTGGGALEPNNYHRFI